MNFLKIFLAFFICIYVTSSYPNQNNINSEKRFIELSSELRCLVCQNQSLLESDSELANDLKEIIYEKINEGQSNNQGLDWICGEVKKIALEQNLKIPHMGWNNLALKKSHPLFNDINPNDHFYFVHSYEFIACSEKDIVATTNHGKNIVAAIAKENIIGLQFHPEKSQIPGLKIISNFIEWDPLR